MKMSQLMKKVRQEFPKLQWKNARQDKSGWDHNVLILDNKYVFRFPWDSESVAILKYEIPLLDFLKSKITLPIPHYAYIAKDKSFAGYHIIPGQRFARSTFLKLTRQQKTVIAKQLAGFLSELHTIPLSKFKRFNVPRYNPKKDYTELVQGYLSHIKPRIKKNDQEIIENFLSTFQNHLSFPTYVFAHSDIHHDNALYNPKNKTLSGIIDFSDRHISDPAIDFNQLWYYGDAFVSEVYAYYSGPKDAAFLNRSLLYYKRDGILVMTEESSGDGRDPFALGYKMYKQSFTKELN